MKIIDITTESYRWPRHKPIRNGKHVYTHSGIGLVKIETDTEITGIGLGATSPIARATIEHLKPELIGEDPLDVERLWHKMWVPKLIGRRGITTRAISAIDIALWDFRAKVAGMPLYKLLGGYRDRVPTYIAGGYYEDGKGLKELAQEMIENVEMGAKAIKMKVGGASIREDVERVKTVREAIGPDVKLMVDANCAYRYYEAIQLARRIEEFDPFWFEEPVAPDDYEGHRKLAAVTTIPIATGENEYTRYGFRDLIAQQAVAILNADAIILGGVTEFMKVVALAQAYDLDIAPHGPQELHVHLVAAIANGLILEFYRDTVDPMWGKIYHHTLRLNDDGTVSPPSVPGIGIEPNYESLAPYRVD
ncbi:MAG: mandelate racemase/muconate lactonizing enzyme family protein [Candidatus Poribacteria bacterium]|nr:mandelate racemase/muconate lactonizing enzyme family protein [Candidatus Poribacteria bacterium]